MFNSSNDRTGLCTFMFEDGRHCNMPHTQSELHLCYFHEKRERQRLLALDAGVKISRYLATNLHTACDLNCAFAMLFRAGSQGYLEPKLLNALTRVGHLVVQTHLLAKEEYLDSYQNEWRDIVLQSIALRPDPEPVPEPASNTNSHPHTTVLPTSQEPPIDELNLMEPSMDIPSPKDPAPGLSGELPEEPPPGSGPNSNPDPHAHVAAGLPRRPSEAEKVEDTEEVEEEQRRDQDTREELQERQTETLNFQSAHHNDDPNDSPETGSHREPTQREPTQRELLRYSRYLQRYSNQPQPNPLQNEQIHQAARNPLQNE